MISFFRCAMRLTRLGPCVAGERVTSEVTGLNRWFPPEPERRERVDVDLSPAPLRPQPLAPFTQNRLMP
jgi:hypothetical protein